MRTNRIKTKSHHKSWRNSDETQRSEILIERDPYEQPKRRILLMNFKVIENNFSSFHEQ